MGYGTSDARGYVNARDFVDAAKRMAAQDEVDIPRVTAEEKAEALRYLRESQGIDSEPQEECVFCGKNHDSREHTSHRFLRESQGVDSEPQWRQDGDA